MASAKPSLLRFVTEDRHEPFGHRSGIVQKAYNVRDDAETAEHLQKALSTELEWLKLNMCTPSKFTRSAGHRKDEVAISWVKSEAREHVDCLRRIENLLKSTRVPTHCLRTSRPGFVVYEDDVQVVAEPSADTPK